MPSLSAQSMEPKWFAEWRADSRARLPESLDPFQVPSSDGTLSDYLLRETALPPSSPLGVARALLESFAKIQTTKNAVFEFGLRTNFSNLQSGNIHLDGEVILTAPYRPKATFEERMDILSGLGVHEIMHLECSSPDLCRLAGERGALFRQIYNTVEDEFIEIELGEVSPGYTGYIRSAKVYMFSDAYRAFVRQDRSLLNAFLLFARYPEGLSWSVASRYERELFDVKRILTPYPNNEAKVFAATERIFELFEKAHRDDHYPEPSPGLQGFLAQASRHHDAPAEAIPPFLRRRLPREVYRESTAKTSGPITWEDATDNPAQYLNDLGEVRPFVHRLRRRLQRWIQPTGYPDSYRRTGRLDPQRLHRIPTGDSRVFKLADRPTQRKMALSLLVDESGSMQHEKIAAARKVAVLFQEALRGVSQLELVIFGHTADNPDGTTNMFRYHQPGSKAKFRIGSMSSRRNNRDGVAVQAAAQETRRVTQAKDIVLFVISDGLPQATGYKGDAAVANTRAVVKRIERRMSVIQIAIDPVLDSSRMFKHHLTFTDLQALPDQMGRLVPKLLDRPDSRGDH